MTAGRRGLIGLLSCEAVSLTGTRLSMVALPWFVLTSTGSATSTGLVAACEAAPYVVSKVLGGPLVDRVGPRRISVLADSASTLTVAAVPLFHALGVLPFGVLLLLVGLTGVVRGPGDNAKRALVPDVAGDAGVPLARATGLSGTIDRLADTAGPALAGVVVAGLGPLTALAMDAASFAIAAVIIGLTAPRGWQPEPSEDRYLTRLHAGIAFVHREPLLRLLVAVVAVTNLVDAALISVLLPVWAKDTSSGPLAIGALSAAVGFTQMLGSITAATLGHRLPRRATFLIGFLLAGAPRFAILALSAPLWVAVTVWALSGCSGGLLNPILQATMFERIPRAMLGRATAVLSSLSSAGTPLAGPLAAGLLTLTGLTPALLLCAGAYLAATTLPAFRPQWRDMNTHHPQQQAAESTTHSDGATGTSDLIEPEPTDNSS